MIAALVSTSHRGKTPRRLEQRTVVAVITSAKEILTSDIDLQEINCWLPGVDSPRPVRSFSPAIESLVRGLHHPAAGTGAGFASVVLPCLKVAQRFKAQRCVLECWHHPYYLQLRIHVDWQPESLAAISHIPNGRSSTKRGLEQAGKAGAAQALFPSSEQAKTGLYSGKTVRGQLALSYRIFGFLRRSQQIVFRFPK